MWWKKTSSWKIILLYGLKIYVKKKSIRRKLKYISLNKWDDFDEQTDDTIIRYLMNKEHLRTIM